MGIKTMANTKDPGIATNTEVSGNVAAECRSHGYTPATVYFVHRLNGCKFQRNSTTGAGKSSLRNQGGLSQNRKQHDKV